MSGNVWEWTTEYSTGYSNSSYHCTYRGGYFEHSRDGAAGDYTSKRQEGPGNYAQEHSLRLLLYVK